jgi:hypothetical protein
MQTLIERQAITRFQPADNCDFTHCG